MFKPARRVLPSRVMVSPMNRAAFIVPLVDAGETYAVPLLYALHPRCHVNVVRNKYCLAG